MPFIISKEINNPKNMLLVNNYVYNLKNYGTIYINNYKKILC